ncbi:MAG: cytochrome c oxidase subunit 3 [Chlamydiota bacterium]
MKTTHEVKHEGCDMYSKTIFGFWLYLFTDFMLFSTLFATFLVLSHSTYGGPSGAQLFHLPYTLIQTMVFLFASFTIGLAAVAAHRRERKWTIVLLMVTFLLGLIFMGMEFSEFSRFIKAGNDWKQSAYLSAFFTLLGTHSIHVIFGLLWIIVFTLPVCWHGLTETSVRRITCLKLFWQFLNVVWIFIFSIVYLLGGVV